MSSIDNLCKQFGPRSGFKQFDSLIEFLKEFFGKVNFEKKSAYDKKIIKNYIACKELILGFNGKSGH